jgi:hypothetical protein
MLNCSQVRIKGPVVNKFLPEFDGMSCLHRPTITRGERGDCQDDVGLGDELRVIGMNNDVLAQVRQQVEALVKDLFDGHGDAGLTSVVHDTGVIVLERTLGTLDKTEIEGTTVSATTKAL